MRMGVTNFKELSADEYYTYQDYLTWSFPERVELFYGKVSCMSPAPNTRHQMIARRLVGSMYYYFEGGGCSLFFAPFDVRLPISLTPNKVDTVVQPDICVICDKSKIDAQGCQGAPDLVIEILSPGNSQKEMGEKFNLYESSGVREYWLVQPESQSVLVYTLNESGKYTGRQPMTAPSKLTSVIFPDLELDLQTILADADSN